MTKRKIAKANLTKKEQYLADFEAITKQILQTTRKKNNDYSYGDDPFRNFTMVEQMGIATTEQGFLTRMTDKMMRLSTFVQGGTLQVADEKVEDTVQDLAVYSILLLCYLRGKK